jgi:hypothetical protein
LSTYYYFSCEEQIKTLFNKGKLPISKNRFVIIDNRSLETISDVYDGELYKKYRRSIQNSTNAYSFTISTDGVNLCDKSNLSIWPVYLVINELDSEERFYIYNTIIAGKIFKIFRN